MSPGAGGVYVVYGRDEGAGGSFQPFVLASDLDGTNGFAVCGDSFAEYLGLAVAGAGDVNADGYDDILIAVENSSLVASACVLFGGQMPGDGSSEIDATLIFPDQGFELLADEVEDKLGSRAASGDVNGDGIADIIVGAPGPTAPVRPGDGNVYVVYGRTPTPCSVADTVAPFGTLGVNELRQRALGVGVDALGGCANGLCKWIGRRDCVWAGVQGLCKEWPRFGWSQNVRLLRRIVCGVLASRVGGGDTGF